MSQAYQDSGRTRRSVEDAEHDDVAVVELLRPGRPKATICRCKAKTKVKSFGQKNTTRQRVLAR